MLFAISIVALTQFAAYYLASHAGWSCGPAGFRARPARRWLSKWATHRRRFPGTPGHPRTYARARSWRQWLELGSHLLPAGGCRRLAGRQQHARGWRLDPGANSPFARATRPCRSTAAYRPISSWPNRCAPAKVKHFRAMNCFSSYRAFPEAQSQKP